MNETFLFLRSHIYYVIRDELIHNSVLYFIIYLNSFTFFHVFYSSHNFSILINLNFHFSFLSSTHFLSPHYLIVIKRKL